jgi:hypothetical protein
MRREYLGVSALVSLMYGSVLVADTGRKLETYQENPEVASRSYFVKRAHGPLYFFRFALSMNARIFA